MEVTMVSLHGGIQELVSELKNAQLYISELFMDFSEIYKRK